MTTATAERAIGRGVGVMAGRGSFVTLLRDSEPIGRGLVGVKVPQLPSKLEVYLSDTFMGYTEGRADSPEGITLLPQGNNPSCFTLALIHAGIIP